MKYGQLVCGPAGSGKSTYCQNIQTHCKTVGRTAYVVNLDPACEIFNYTALWMSGRQLISVDGVLEDEELSLGPNGSLIFCMEYLVENLEWLHEQLDKIEDDYFLFDCPGQIELYSHLPIMRKIVDAPNNGISTYFVPSFWTLVFAWILKNLSLQLNYPFHDGCLGNRDLECPQQIGPYITMCVVPINVSNRREISTFLNTNWQN